jgi:excisionase family DNA binding protein
MTTIRPEITGRVAGANDVEPLAVSPRQVCFLLSVGTTRLYELIRAGELQAYYEGRARRITVESIRAFGSPACLRSRYENRTTAPPRPAPKERRREVRP